MRANPELEVCYARDRTVVAIPEKVLQTAESPVKRIWSEEVSKIVMVITMLNVFITITIIHHS